uniref:DNA polymerase alpha subunit B N-terminal domain-containing protein n=1 Tax=Anopheles atroparvus TaxID=41427 RepID=A0A182IW80_ANOAO
MVSVETIREQFDELGIEPSDDIINKCIEICINNDINDPVEFVEQWMAYSVSKLGGAEPTVAFLNEMEAHEYTSKTARKVKASSLTGVGLGNIASPRLDSKVSKITTYRNVDSTEQDVLEMYGCITPKMFTTKHLTVSRGEERLEVVAGSSLPNGRTMDLEKGIEHPLKTTPVLTCCGCCCCYSRKLGSGALFMSSCVL